MKINKIAGICKRAKEYELKGVSYTIHYPTYKGEPTSMWKLIPIKLMPPASAGLTSLPSGQDSPP